MTETKQPSLREGCFAYGLKNRPARLGAGRSTLPCVTGKYTRTDTRIFRTKAVHNSTHLLYTAIFTRLYSVFPLKRGKIFIRASLWRSIVTLTDALYRASVVRIGGRSDPDTPPRSSPECNEAQASPQCGNRPSRALDSIPSGTALAPDDSESVKASPCGRLFA